MAPNGSGRRRPRGLSFLATFCVALLCSPAGAVPPGDRNHPAGSAPADLTALENIGLPLVYRGLGPGEIARRSRAMLEKVGMKGRSRHLPSQLSGGQRQRIAIARALVGEPAVILADEPTGTLDSGAAREVMELLVELNARDRITIVIITHDASIARRCARHTRLMDGVLREGPLGRP